MKVDDGGGKASESVDHSSETESAGEAASSNSNSSSSDATSATSDDEGGLQAAATNVDSSDDSSQVDNSAAEPEQQELQDDVRRSITQANLSGPAAGPTPPEATVTNTADGIVVDAGDGDDEINVTQDKTTNDVTVEVNGEQHTFTGPDTNNLIIRGGTGNDRVTVDSGVTVDLRIEGGDGNDYVRGGSGNDKIRGGAGNDELYGAAGNDRIEAGEGNDVVSGGDGRDYIDGSRGTDNLYGNAGNDVIYGGEGDDQIAGNEGDDFVEGSGGNDFVSGNEGDDVVSGGRGDDEIWGAEGDDVIYAGDGKDRLFGSSGNDTIYAKADDEVDGGAGTNTTQTVAYDGKLGSSITITGSDEFRERAMADIDFLRFSPTGQQMLTALDGSGQSLTIQQYDTDNGGADWPNRTVAGAPQPFIDAATGTPGTPDNGIISYNPTYNQFPMRDPADPADDWRDIDPLVVLYHEMAHSYNIMTGTFQNGSYGVPNPAGRDPLDVGVANLERQAVGLDNDGLSYDFDGDASTPTTTANPQPLTENGLRDELHRDRRPTYNVWY